MNYFSEFQERIREIRILERFFYQKIKDIYTTSIDYDAKDEKTIAFFKVVQNKLLWAISQQTAAELVYPKLFQKLSDIIISAGYKVKLLVGTDDYYCRDYMPIQVSEKDFVQFVFSPEAYFKGEELNFITQRLSRLNNATFKAWPFSNQG
jgi:hypothetical protein